MIRLPAILLTVVAAATAYPWTPLPHTRTTAKLSQARRNLGAATLDGKAYFAGGCLTTGKNTQFICDHASDAVDVLDESGALLKTMQLSQPRGWVAVCVNSQEVIMAGGGTSGVTPHSRVADIVSSEF